MNVVLFEDGHVDDNRPATLARPAFAVTCGGANLYDTVGLFDVSVRTVIREYLIDTARASFPSEEQDPSSGPALFLNAALVPDVAAIRKLVNLAGEAEPFLATSGQRVAAALVPDASALGSPLSPENVSAMLLEQKLPLRDEALRTIDYPFHIVKFHAELLEANLTERVGRGGIQGALPERPRRQRREDRPLCGPERLRRPDRPRRRRDSDGLRLPRRPALRRPELARHRAVVY